MTVLAALAYLVHPYLIAPGGVLVGSGATFPQAQLEAWMSSFNSAGFPFKIEYVGKGSGGGQSDLSAGVVDFICTDPPLSSELWARLRERGDLVEFPFILGAVVVTYNLPGVDRLRLNGSVLAEMYMGNIRYWDDERILALNPGLRGVLPHREILLVHRSDSSGTTYLFTSFLSLSSEEWRRGVGRGKLVRWPVDELGRGLGGQGNLGVSQLVMKNQFSLGYVEWSFALQLNMPIAELSGKGGGFAVPTVEGLMEVADSALRILDRGPEDDWDGDVDVLLETAFSSGYPLVGWSHLVFYRGDGRILQWLSWTREEGTTVPGYAPIPDWFWEEVLE